VLAFRDIHTRYDSLYFIQSDVSVVAAPGRRGLPLLGLLPLTLTLQSFMDLSLRDDPPQIFLSGAFFHHVSTFNNFTSLRHYQATLIWVFPFSESLQAARRLSFCKVSFPPFWLNALTTLSWLLVLLWLYLGLHTNCIVHPCWHSLHNFIWMCSTVLPVHPLDRSQFRGVSVHDDVNISYFILLFRIPPAVRFRT
jgi:hypothetical protein